MLNQIKKLFNGEEKPENNSVVGTVIKGRYQVIKVLQSGGMGNTYLAIDLDIPTIPKPKCVIKKLQPQHKNNPDITRLFKKEAEILYKLGNEQENIPKLYAYFVEDGDFCLVQEYINGDNLTEEMGKAIYPQSSTDKNALPPTVISTKKWTELQVIDLLKEVLTILVFVHQQNVIHRDIKPANIMRCREDGKLKLIDFGSVKEISSQAINNQGQTQLTVSIGTPGYIPSEQALGRPNFSSDLYALGITAIQALTGISPDSLPRERNEIFWRNLAIVSDELAEFLTKMVRYDCYQRYETATEALEVLNKIPIPEPKLVPIELNGKYGFISQGRVVIPFEFDAASLYFSEELAMVEKDEKWGYINTQGELVIPCQFDYIWRFSEGLASVKKDGKWGFINTKGEQVIPFQFDDIEYFSEGLERVKKDGKWGFINTKGELVTLCQFDNTWGFSKGLAGVKKDGKYGYINTEGELVIPCQFDDVHLNFSEGLAMVKKDGKYGYINTQYELILPCQFDEIKSFSEGLAMVKKDGKYGYINTQYELILPCQFDEIKSFSEGLAAVKKDEKWGYINTKGELVIPYQFDEIKSFSEGLAAVKKDEKWGFINTKGKLVIPCQFDYAEDFEEGLAKVKINNKEHLINKLGEIVY